MSGLMRGGAAIADQGLFAGGHFLVALLLARWMPPAEYGAFAIAYSVLVLLVAAHVGLVTEPMMVFGAGKYGGRFRSYLATLLSSHVALAGLGIAVFLAAAAVAPARMTPAFLGGAVAAPGLLLVWLARRAFYVRGGPARAALASAMYLVAGLGGVLLLRSADRLDAFTVFPALGVAALIAAVPAFGVLKPEFGPPARRPALGAVARDHWRYGKWAVAAGAMAWIPWNAYFAFLPIWTDLESVGALRASMNLVLPMLHVSAAIGLALLPEFSRLARSGSHRPLAGQVGVWWGLITLAGVVYLAVLVGVGPRILSLLYAGRYDAYSGLIVPVGLVAVLAGSVSIPGAALRAKLRPDRVCGCYTLSGVLTLTAGLGLTALSGVGGAAIGVAISYCALAIATLRFYRRGMHELAIGA